MLQDAKCQALRFHLIILQVLGQSYRRAQGLATLLCLVLCCTLPCWAQDVLVVHILREQAVASGRKIFGQNQ